MLPINWYIGAIIDNIIPPIKNPIITSIAGSINVVMVFKFLVTFSENLEDISLIVCSSFPLASPAFVNVISVGGKYLLLCLKPSESFPHQVQKSSF